MGLTRGQGIALICFVVLVLVIAIGYSGIFEKKVSFAPKSGPTRPLCGSMVYNPYTQGCCGFGSNATVFNLVTQTCCDNIVFSLNENPCCGSTNNTFNPDNSKCCEGEVINSSTTKCCPVSPTSSLVEEIPICAGSVGCCRNEDCPADKPKCIRYSAPHSGSLPCAKCVPA